jgi:hypothetical protein
MPWAYPERRGTKTVLGRFATCGEWYYEFKVVGETSLRESSPTERGVRMRSRSGDRLRCSSAGAVLAQKRDELTQIR